jgi:RHS repeat-associated protein
VSETGSGAAWSQSFGYDLVGNRWLSGGTQIDPLTPFTGNTNPFNANNQLNGTGYDSRGNQTTNGGYIFAYDAENRLITTNMFGTTYGYDADGRRVTKTSSGVTTAYVYDVTGQLAAQYTTGGEGTAPCLATCYLMTDHLGSTRMETDSGGNQLTLYDYAPFGEELAGLDGRDARWGGFGSGIHFTGKEQEGYEGDYMHYFGARYFSAGLGRWTSPDPLGYLAARLWNPQSWNLYGYAFNNPFRFVDLSGTCSVKAGDDAATDDPGEPCVAAGDTSTTVTATPDDVPYYDCPLCDVLQPTGGKGPTETPLTPYAQAFFKELGKRIDTYPTVCGGGFYSYAGKELEVGPVNAFAGVITEYDSRAGVGKGALFEGGGGEGLVGGVGYIGSTTGGRATGEGLAYFGVGAKSNVLSGSAGVVGFGSSRTIGGAGIYADGFFAGRGGGLGAYVNISSIGGCR